MRRAQATARTTGSNISRSMDQMRVRTVQSFGAVRIAAAGLGLAMGVGIFAAGVRSAFEFASSLSETARQTGVTVEQLQVLRRAAIENGGSIEGMERSLSILNRTIGQARAGVPAAAQAFRALRIDPEQFTSAGAVLPRVMEAIRNLRTQSEQAAAAQRLMGRGAAEMLPFLVQGAAGMDRATEAARRHGLITAEQAERADEAKDAIDGLAETIRINLGIAIANNVGAIRGWIANIESMGGAVAGLIGRLESLRAWLNDTQFQMRQYGLLVASLFNPNARLQAQAEAANRPAAPSPGAGAGDFLIRRIAANRVRPTTGTDDLDLSPGGGGGRRGGGRNAAEDAARRRHEVETELARARMDELRAQLEVTHSAETRADLNLQISFMEQAQAEADRTLARLLKDRTQAEADAVADIETRTFHARRQAVEEEELDRIAGERREVQAGALEDVIALTSAEADLAETAGERREVQLRLLSLAQQQERLEQEAILASRDATDAQKAIARARLDSLGSTYAARQQGVENANRGPMGDFLASLPTTADRANEALQRVAAEGLASIADGLTDAIMGVRSLGDVFKAIANQIIADLIRIAIQQAIVAGLNAVMGGGGGGGLFGSLFGGTPSIPGRASGGPVLPGRTYRVGEKGMEILRMGTQGGSIIPNHELGGGPGHVVIELRDEMLDARIVSGSVQVVRAAAPSMVQGAKAATFRDLRRPRL